METESCLAGRGVFCVPFLLGGGLCSLPLSARTSFRSGPESASWPLPQQSSLSGHQQAAEGAAAPGEEEAAGGEAPAKSPGEQEQPPGQQQRRRGGRRAGHLGEDLCCSQHLTRLLGCEKRVERGGLCTTCLCEAVPRTALRTPGAHTLS